MKTEKITINGKEFTKITAESGMSFQRKHDGFVMGKEIVLGIDYSTGVMRVDLPEYYEEQLITEPETNLNDKVQALEETTNDIIDVMNERGYYEQFK
jgi:hypothetical protein